MSKRKWLESDWKMLARLNSVPVKKEDLLELVDESVSLPGAHGEPGSDMFLIVIRYHGNPEKGQAIYFRIEALIGLLKSESVPGWALPPAGGGVILNKEAVLTAAALEPLVRLGDDIGFDKKSFLNRILAEAEPVGNA